MHAVMIIANSALFALPVLGWLRLAFGVGDAKLLAARGFESLKYFTVLSNLFAAIVALLALITHAAGSTALPEWLVVLKLESASAVMVTFLTVILLLGPKFGWKSMYQGGNLHLHLVAPLLAALDCVLLVPAGTLPLGYTALAMIPPALYGVWYLRNIMVHGAEENGKVYDFYGFLRWGTDKIPLVAVGMLGMAWAIAAALWLASKALCLV